MSTLRACICFLGVIAVCAECASAFPPCEEAELQSLINELKSPYPAVRERAITRLTELGSRAKQATPVLLDMAVSTSGGCSAWPGDANALKALVAIDDGVARLALKKMLVNERKFINASPSSVARVGLPIVPFLVALLPDRAFRADAERTLIQIGAPIVPHVLSNFSHRDQDVRLSLYRVLGGIGPTAKAALPALEKCLDREAGTARIWVATSIYMIHRSHQDSVTVMHDAVRSDDAGTRDVAFVSLVQTRCNASELIPTMVMVIRDENDNHFESAVRILANIGVDAATPLEVAVKGANARQSRRLVMALAALGPKGASAIPMLTKFLDDDDGDLALLVVQRLPIFGPKAKQAIPALQRKLEVKNFLFRQACINSLHAIDPEHASVLVAPTVEILSHGTNDERRLAIEALIRMKSVAKPATSTLVAMFRTEPFAIRLSAARALAEIDASQMDIAMPTLLEALRSRQNDKLTLKKTLAIIEKAGPKAAKAESAVKDVLRAALKDPQNTIYPFRVVMCLKRIGAEKEVLPIVFPSLNSTDSGEREEACAVLEFMGKPTVGPLEAAITSGELRMTPELQSMLKLLGSRLVTR